MVVPGAVEQRCEKLPGEEGYARPLQTQSLRGSPRSLRSPKPASGTRCQENTGPQSSESPRRTPVPGRQKSHLPVAGKARREAVPFPAATVVAGGNEELLPRHLYRSTGCSE